MKKRGACKLEPDPAVEQVERGDARKRTAEAHERPFQQKGHANVMGGRAHQPEQLQFPHAGEHGELTTSEVGVFCTISTIAAIDIRKYLVVTMVAALRLQVVGNSTSRCWKTTSGQPEEGML